MDQKFIDWITKKHEKMTASEKRSFFLKLKNEPSIARRIIARNLPEWGTVAMMEIDLGMMAIYNNDDAAAVLVEHFQKHFAKEIEKVA